MKFLKRIFGGRRGSARSAAGPELARELEAQIAEAERLVAAARYEEALQVAERGLRRFPTATRLRDVIQYIRRTSANKRLQHLKQRLSERKDARAYREYISLLVDLGNRDTAFEVASRYVEEFPNHAEAQSMLGKVYLARYFGELFARDAWAAVECFERARDLDPEAIHPHLMLAMLYYSIGAPRHCVNAIGEVLRIDPTNTRMAEFRGVVLQVTEADAEEDIEYLLDYAEDHHQIPNDPADFPGGGRFAYENKGGALSPKLFAAAAAGIGRRLRIEQLAAVGAGGRPLAVAGENKESFVRLACRLDGVSRRAGRHMNFGTMRGFMAEGKFGRIVLVPAGSCAVAARAPRSISTKRIAEGLDMVITASRAEENPEDA